MKVTIITDGSWCPDTKAAGYGWWGASKRRKAGGGGYFKSPLPTSRAAEIGAIVNAVHQSFKFGIAEKGDFLLLQSDCKGAIEYLKRSYGRAKTIERSMLKEFKLMQKTLDFQFAIRHVKGHTNEAEARMVAQHCCDTRAYYWMQKMREKLRK